MSVWVLLGMRILMPGAMLLFLLIPFSLLTEEEEEQPQQQ
jgi:hypothetical protein